MTEKNILAYKLFLPLNISDFFWWKLQPPPPAPPKKGPNNPTLKVEVLSSPPFLKICLEVQFPPAEKGWCTPCVCFRQKFFKIDADLSNRKRRVKTNDRYSLWSEILFGVPQGSILEPFFVHIFICDMFYFLEDFVNYVDDYTP